MEVAFAVGEQFSPDAVDRGTATNGGEHVGQRQSAPRVVANVSRGGDGHARQSGGLAKALEAVGIVAGERHFRQSPKTLAEDHPPVP